MSLFARAACFVWLLLAPMLADACPVCFQSTEENRLAFIITTVFLSLLPLVTIGSFVWWLRRRALELEREDGNVETHPGTARAL